MLTLVLALHSWLRWLALVALVVSVVLAVGKHNDGRAKGVSLVTFISFHTQLLLGLLLYAVFSPTTATAFADFGAAMKDATLRFWAVEHLSGMLIAIVLVTLGHLRAKRAPDDALAARRRLLFFVPALLLTLALIPWPFRAVGRALFWLGGDA